MKRFNLLLLAVLTIGFSTALSLPNFWYSGIAYNSSGQIITASPLAAVQVTVSDGSNTAIQNYINVPVNGFGVFTVQVTGAGAVNMLSNTYILVKVNGILVAGQPLTQWYIMNNILPAGGSTTDMTIDAWVNNFPQTRIELGTLSDNTTARPAGTEYTIKDNGRVSIGTTSTGTTITPAKVTILNTDLYQGISSLNKVAVTSVPWWASSVMGVDSSNNIFGSGISGFYSGHIPSTGVYGLSSQDKDFSGSSTTYTLGYLGGQFWGGDVGVAAGILGTGTSTNKYAVYAETSTIDANHWAGYFKGRLAVIDGTEGNGKVLTSDATGNASWQDQNSQSVGISMRGLSSTLTIPTGTTTPITQWSGVLSEDGGANYNSSTGEYTITVAGTYQINCNILWDPASSSSGTSSIYLNVNGGFTLENTAAISSSAYVTNVVAFSRRFNVNDKISFSVVQQSGSNMTIQAFYTQAFSVQYLHK